MKEDERDKSQGDEFAKPPQTSEQKLTTSTSLGWASDEDDIREAVFRYQFTNNRAGANPFANIFYLSVEDGRDPTDEFMARFQNPAHRVKKVSQCTASVSDGVKDRKTEKPGVILRVENIIWISEDEVSVDGGHYVDGLNRADNVHQVVREDGKWIVKDEQNLCIS
jgi:hypothetical protein